MDGNRRQVDLIELYVKVVTQAAPPFSLPPPSPSSRLPLLIVGACDRARPPERTYMDRPNNPVVGLVTSKGWTLESVLASGPRFRTVDKTSANSGTPEQIASTIKDYEQRGVPLVVQDLHGRPDWPEFFTPEWLEAHYGSRSAPTPEPSIQSTSSNISYLSG